MQPHPLRETLHHEVHARPYERLAPTLLLSHIACVDTEPAAARLHLESLLRARHLPLPAVESNHLSVDLGGIRLRWEKHSEFHTYTFWKQLREAPQNFDQGPLQDIPHDWLAALPGQWLVGLHLAIVATQVPTPELPALVRLNLDEDSLVGGRVMDQAADVFTDFRLHGDGYSRWVILAGDLTPRRLGRLAQRVLEVETYRMMALLGLCPLHARSPIP